MEDPLVDRDGNLTDEGRKLVTKDRLLCGTCSITEEELETLNVLLIKFMGEDFLSMRRAFRRIVKNHGFLSFPMKFNMFRNCEAVAIERLKEELVNPLIRALLLKTSLPKEMNE